MKMIKDILFFFDKLEDKVRGAFSHYPIVYAIVGGIGTVLFWRGVWHMADFVSVSYIIPHDPSITINLPSFVDGAASFVAGLCLLLITGLFVATFIGDHIIVSGLRKEKKLADKTEEEVQKEESIVKQVHDELHSLSESLEKVQKKLDERSKFGK